MKNDTHPQIEIVNLRTKRPRLPWDFRVDRNTAVGNPFEMHGESMRDEVCDNYELWFKKQLKTQPEKSPFRKLLADILDVYLDYGKVRLFCWCAPKRCHAETIKRWIIEEI